jgi:hypothetical protein
MKVCQYYENISYDISKNMSVVLFVNKVNFQ